MKQYDLTRGSVKGHFARYFVPTLLSNFSVSAFAFVDMFYVGKGVGADGLAVLSLALPFVIVGGVISLLLGIGGCTILGIETGRRNERAGTELFSLCVSLGAIAGVLITAVVLLFLDPIARFSGASEELLPMVKDYLLPLTATQVLYILNQIIGFFVRVDGAPNLVMGATIASNSFNIIFDYVFIFPMGMGVFGASLATGLAPAVGIAVNLLHFRKGHPHTIAFRPSKAMFSWLGRVAKNGFGSCVSELASAFTIFCFNNAMLRLGGDLAVSAYSVVSNLSFVVFSMCNSIGLSAQPLVGVNYGAGKGERVKRSLVTAYAVAVGFGLFLFALFQLFPSQVIGVFAKAGEDALIAVGTHGLRLYSFAFLTMACNLTTIAVFQGLECSRSANLLSICKGVVFMLLGLWTLSSLLGVDGVWLTTPSSELLTFLLCIGLLIYNLRSRLAALPEESAEPAVQGQ